MSFAKRLDALQSLAPFTINDEKLREELKQIVAALSSAENERNTIVHSCWVYCDQELTRIKPTAKRKHGLKSFLHTDGSLCIEKATTTIEAAAKRFAGYTRKLQEHGVIQMKIVR